MTEGRAVDLLTSPYWSGVVSGTGLYRLVTLLSFALEWRFWNGHPVGFHLVNISVHLAVSLMVFLLILDVSATLPGLVGGLLLSPIPSGLLRAVLAFPGDNVGLTCATKIVLDQFGTNTGSSVKIFAGGNFTASICRGPESGLKGLSSRGCSSTAF